MLTYVYPVWSAVPYLSIGGPLNSGKTRTFEVLSQVVFATLSTSNMSAPCLFRTLHDRGGTFLLDKAERLKDRTPDAGDMRSILLAGYKRGGQAHRLESVGDGFQSVAFDVFGPKAIAGISTLPPALASRCIRIMMFRVEKDSPIPKRGLDPDAEKWTDLRDDLHAMALVYGQRCVDVVHQGPDVEGINGRDRELWLPLLRMAFLVQESGAEHLVEFLTQHMHKCIQSGQDDAVPETDEVVLHALKDLLGENPHGVRAGQVLDRVKDEEASLFGLYSARGIGAILNRYGLRSNRSGGKRYYRMTAGQWKSIQQSYGITLGFIKEGDADG